MQYSITNFSHHAVCIFPGLIFFVTGGLYLLTTFIHFTHLPHPISGNHQSVLCIYKLDGIFVLFLDSTLSEIIQYFSFSVWLISLSIIPLRTIYIVKSVIIFSFYGWIILHCVCVYSILFIHSSINRHLSCFHMLAIVNHPTMSMEVHVFLRHCFPFL